MPSTMGYVGGAKHQPVYYPPGGKPKGFARGLGAGRPAKARSNQIRKVIQRRALHAGVGPQPQAGPAGSITTTRGHHDRAQPPVSINMFFGDGGTTKSKSNQGGRQSRPLAGGKRRAVSNDAVTRMRKPKGMRGGPLRGYTQG